LKLVGASLLALALALAVYCLVSGYGAAWLLRSEWFTALLRERQETSVQAYQAYVIESGMSVRQVLEEPGWEGADPSTTIYSVVVGDWEEEGAVAVSMSQMSTDGSVSIYMEPLRCADGELYLTAAPNWAWLEGLVRIAALVLAAAVFCAVVVPYILHLLRRIEALSRETGALMAGDLSHSIRAPGRDELSRLGADIERLRLSVLERLEGEREAVGATGRLITGLSHDLRTPITVIKGYVEGIQDGIAATEEKRQHYLSTIYNKTLALEQLVADMRDFSEYELGRMQYHFERVDLTALLKDLVQEYRMDVEGSGMSLEAQLPEQALWTTADRRKLKRVLDNLVSNAVKYGRAGGEVSLTGQAYQGGIIVQVSDNGRGISPQAMGHIFDSFYREDTARSSTVPGSGLGLAICKSIMESHHGKIWLTSREGEGTDAYLYLPLTKEVGE